MLLFIGDRPGAKSGEISKKLDIAIPPAKRILAGLVEKQLIEKHGIGSKHRIKTAIGKSYVVL